MRLRLLLFQQRTSRSGHYRRPVPKKVCHSTTGFRCIVTITACWQRSRDEKLPAGSQGEYCYADILVCWRGISPVAVYKSLQQYVSVLLSKSFDFRLTILPEDL